MTITWLTSDQHFGHRGILRHRAFADLDAMHAELIAKHNERVQPGDIVWHLGDFSLDESDMGQNLPRLNGRHRLIVGNHDRVHPCHRQAWKAHEAYRRAGFEVIAERAILGDPHFGRVFLSHLPLAGSGDHGPEERYPGWRPTAELLREAGCSVLLHGHVHTDYAERWVPRRTPLGEMAGDPTGRHARAALEQAGYPQPPEEGIACINVGVDVRGFAPVSAAEVRGVIERARKEAA